MLTVLVQSIAQRHAAAPQEEQPEVKLASSCLPAEAIPDASARQFDQTQLGHAATIIAVGKQMGVPPEGQVIAIATSIQESGLRNLEGGHWDSAGLFQQRPGAGWGTHAQVTTPTYAARQFYEHLLALPGWQQMPLTQAAQAVQRSAFPLAYAAHEDEARYIVGLLSEVQCGDTSGGGAWVVPVDATCTSWYGMRGGAHHQGLDLGAPIGTTIVAAHSGKVIDSGPASGFGLWVRIQHPNGIVTTYGHIHRSLVEVGETVKTGEEIALVGNRGQSSGPHLHFEVAVNGQAQPPQEFYRQHKAPPLC